jgi:aminoglycoside phosphotransferase (APT) family kinase protein
MQDRAAPATMTVGGAAGTAGCARGGADMTGCVGTDEAAAGIRDALLRLGLVGAGDSVTLEPLAGGVSSDIWRVDLHGGPVCVKRALPRLKVSQVWEAPVERNRHEFLWFETVAAIDPAIVPRLIAAGAADGLFVMEFLDPARHPVWKRLLGQGGADPEFAGRVGRAIAGIHAATADRPDLASRFDTGPAFHALRLEPYLEAAARRHPDRAAALRALAHATATTRRTLVHGDVSPKNILCGPDGPIFLDAECAWYGDPAFDLAFCLNHLLLKCLWVPAAAPRFLECFHAFRAAYLAGVGWEDVAAVESRAACLLPGLLLARVDGKSPVEYVTSDAQRDVVRRVARALLAAPAPDLAAVARAWHAEIRP